MKKIISMVVMLVITFFTFVNPVNAQGLEKVVVQEGTFGCVHKDYYSKLIRTLVNNDKDAFVQGLLAAYESGECVRLEVGKVVFLSDSDFSSAMSKIRPKGGMDEYWTDMLATKYKF